VKIVKSEQDRKVAQARDTILHEILLIARTWAAYDHISTVNKCEGVAYSILAMLDGCSIGVPLCYVVTQPDGIAINEYDQLYSQFNRMRKDE